MAASTAVGAQTTPIKVQGKEYKIKNVDADTLEATAVSRSMWDNAGLSDISLEYRETRLSSHLCLPPFFWSS
jgi:hypothetical protein